MADLVFVVPLVVASLVSLGLFALTAMNIGQRGSYSLMALFGSIAVWAGAYAVQLTTTTLSAAIVWNNVRFFGVAIAPVATLVFAMQYTGRQHWVTRRTVAALFLVPLLTNVVIWTNPAHMLWGIYKYRSSTELVRLTTAWGPWFLVHTVYSFAAGLAAVGLFAGKLVGEDSRTGRTTAFLVATLLPLLGSLTTVLGYAPLDMAPFAFAVSGVLIATAIFYL